MRLTIVFQIINVMFYCNWTLDNLLQIGSIRFYIVRKVTGNCAGISISPTVNYARAMKIQNLTLFNLRIFIVCVN